jgi:hypothetical protein
VLFVATEAGVVALDVAEPSTPRYIAVYESAEGADGVWCGDSRLYVAEPGGLRVLDVSDPARPRQVGAYATASHAQDVWVDGDLAYVAAYEAGLYVLRVGETGE